MSLRVLNATGTGDVANAVEAIDYAVSQGAQVINCSWGTEAESQSLRDAIERAGGRGVVVVASAGNNSRDLEAQPYFPASYNLPNLIAVAATDQFDNLASFSNWGGSRVVVGAPGVNILTTKMGGDYWHVSGTSASAPLVSGIAGMVKSVRPWLSAAATKQAVVDGARRVDVLAGRVASGGVASALGALDALSGANDPFGGGGGPRGQTPRPQDPGHGRGNYRRDPPASSGGALSGFPNLDEIADQPSYIPSGPPATIRSNLPPICDTCYQGGGTDPTDPEFSNSRSKRANETGEEGEDLGSRNFNWGTGLVSLPGRAGLDLNISLYYNSLVWTKQQTLSGAAIQYNADNGFPGPGFHLGFPTLQERFTDSDTGAYAYMMITTSGGRAKLRQVGASSTYEATDGTYAQLTEAGNATVVRTTDGTQYKFGLLVGGERRCTEVKDRNGNFITITYNGAGRVQTVKDTLERVVTFNYDADGNLSSLTQPRAGMLSTLVSFSYGTRLIQPDFPGLFVHGPVGEYISVLTEVKFTDDSRYNFDYTPFGQVYKISHRAPDGHLLSYTGYNLPGSEWLVSSSQTDCPRFTQRRDWIQLGVMNADSEIVTTYNVAADGSWSEVTMPDNATRYKEYFATSGWQTGLTTQSEMWAKINNVWVKKKLTTLAWTQDDLGLTYAKNPRVSETNVYDVTNETVHNRRRTTIDYTSFSLPAPCASGVDWTAIRSTASRVSAIK